MRICFLSRRYFPAISGMSVYAQNYLRELVREGHEVVMLSQYRNDEAGTKIYGGGPPPEVPGVQVIGLESVGEQMVNEGKPADFELDLRTMVDTALELHAEKSFDIVHAQYGYPPGLAALEISRQTGIPNVVSIQGGDGHWVGLCCETHRRAIQSVLFHANETIIGSVSFAEEVREHHGVPPERFTIIPGAINAERFAPRPDRPLGELSEIPHLLYHGRVDRRKGVLELIEAVELLVGKGSELLLTISGIGPDSIPAQELVAEKGLKGSIQFSGYVDYHEVPAVYRKADLFVSPTWSEGFSNTILEAMASGLPIVASRSIGVVDCLVDEDTGLFHEVHDVPELAAQIERILTDAALRERLATNALAEIELKYKWPVVAGQIIKRLEATLAKAPDNSWTELRDPATTVEIADTNCRFRQSPHLL